MSALQQSPMFREAIRAGGAVTTDVADGFMIRRLVPVLGEVGLLSRSRARDVAALRAARADGLRVVNAETLDDAPPLRRAGFRQIITPAHIAEVDLTGTPDARRRAMKQKWRNRLHRAERAGLKIRPLGWSGGDHWLITNEAAQRAKRRYRTLPGPLLATMARTSPKAALIVEAWAGAEPVAGMLFLRHGDTATYQLGWTSPHGRKLNAHALVLTRAMDRLADEGHRSVDLGLIETQTTPGLARFKLGAGATVRQLGGTWLALPGF